MANSQGDKRTDTAHMAIKWSLAWGTGGGGAERQVRAWALPGMRSLSGLEQSERKYREGQGPGGPCQSYRSRQGEKRGLLVAPVIHMHHRDIITTFIAKRNSTPPAPPTLLQDQRKGVLEPRTSMSNKKRGSTQWEASPTARVPGACLAPGWPGEQQAHPERVEIWSPVRCWENKNYKQCGGQ